MTEQIFQFLADDARRLVTIGYKLPEGKIVRVFRKMNGHSREAIEGALSEIKTRGHAEVVAELYRPNGSTEVVARTVVIPADQIEDKPATMGSTPTLFDNYKPAPKQATFKTPAPQPEPAMNQDWKDYALKTELEKVKKLSDELRRVTEERNALDSKVREFEKEMIKKDHELEKAVTAAEGKGTLSGVIKDISSTKESREFALGAIVTAIKTLKGEPVDLMAAPGGAIGAIPEGSNPQTEQYVANIRKWLAKQSPELQQQFYDLVYALTNQGDVPRAIIHITNLLQGNPMTGTNG